MIFVILGTQDKTFERLIKAVEKQIKLGNITEEVIVQAGNTKYESNDMKILNYINNEEFKQLINKANLIITHGGVGTITTALRLNKKVIAAARLEKYQEHVNDHQLQVIDSFVQKGYILELREFEELDKVLEKIKNFQPNKFESNTSNFIENLDKELKNT